MISKKALIEEIKLRLAQSCKLQPRCNCSDILEILNYYLGLDNGSE